MRLKRIGLHLLLVTAVSLASGCGKDSDSNSSPLRRPSGSASSGDGKIKVTCTTGMVADVVRNVGGEHVDVTQLMGEGVDPHTYKVSSGDVSQLNDSAIIFYSGLHLEPSFIKVFDSLGAKKPVCALTKDLERWHSDKLIRAEGNLFDPHVWFDVSLWKTTLKVVANQLADYDPENAAEYVANAKAYGEKLDALHEECRKTIASIPAERRVLITAHDAFHYFGRVYGIEVKAIQGVSTESQASIKEIEELIDFIVERKIKSVMRESTINKKSMQQIIDGCAKKKHTVSQGGELFSDAMGKAGTPEGTYEGMVRHNIRTIAEALK